MTIQRLTKFVAAGLLVVSAATLQAQAKPQSQVPGGTAKPNGPTPPVMPAPPTGYVIGVDDVLFISVWREKDLSVEVVVLPDGKVTVPLVNEMQAAGLTVEELRTKITAALAAKNLIADALVSVGVKHIKSRKVYITGAVNKPGEYELAAKMTITHLITVAGGLLEFANQKEIMVIRGSEKKPNGEPVTIIVNYEDLQKGKNLVKNLIYLMPGDQVLVKQ